MVPSFGPIWDRSMQCKGFKGKTFLDVDCGKVVIEYWMLPRLYAGRGLQPKFPTGQR